MGRPHVAQTDDAKPNIRHARSLPDFLGTRKVLAGTTALPTKPNSQGDASFVAMELGKVDPNFRLL
jgi:hypothetical protein